MSENPNLTDVSPKLLEKMKAVAEIDENFWYSDNPQKRMLVAAARSVFEQITGETVTPQKTT